MSFLNSAKGPGQKLRVRPLNPRKVLVAPAAGRTLLTLSQIAAWTKKWEEFFQNEQQKLKYPSNFCLIAYFT